MKKYLITSREFYTDTPAVFRSILHEQLSEHLPEYALYRDKTNPAYATQASHFVEVCKQFESIKSFIHSDIELAKNLNATGVHLTSCDIEKIPKAKDSNLEVIVSTHTKEEALLAQKLGADAITYSPIFTTPNKGEPKGVKKLSEIVNLLDIKVFALGGIITQKEVDAIERSACYGFASIRYFYWKK